MVVVLDSAVRVQCDTASATQTSRAIGGRPTVGPLGAAMVLFIDLLLRKINLRSVSDRPCQSGSTFVRASLALPIKRRWGRS